MAAKGGLSGVAIRRPIFTAMIMAGLLVLGFFSYRRLAIDLFPEVDFPIVSVQTVYPGASPETIEREVTRRLEESFNTIQGVDEIWSFSYEGASMVMVWFELDRDVDEAAQDVRGRIDGVRRDLPADIEAPVVQTFDPLALPILSLAISSPTMPVEDLTVIADEDVRRRLESISGVGEVRRTGGLARQIRVDILPDRMQAFSVTVTDVMGALQRQNMEVPAGRVESGPTEELVRVTGRITDPAQFEDVIVANRNGTSIRLRDVARVTVGTEEERSAALVNGSPAVSLDILKVSGANTVEVADRVNEAIEELQAELPAAVDIQVVRDNSVMIRQSVESVIHELMLGALLTVIVVMLFLNDVKAMVITSLALPVSVISAFILMAAMGFTLNMLTLMALALSIGILIDDAIVVIENIVRHREQGADHFSAAAGGTKEIILAVMATTFSIVAVFVPVAFMGGIVGRFFFQFGLTVAWAVLVSLFVSFTLTPTLSAWWGVDPHAADEERRGNVVQRTIARFNRWFRRRTEEYRGVLAWALGHRRTTVGIAVAALVGALLLFPFIGGAFMPTSDQGEFVVQYETAEGASLDFTRSKGTELAARIRELDGVDYTYTTAGGGGSQGVFGSGTAGEIYVKLVHASERDRSARELSLEARRRIRQVFGVETIVLTGTGPGGHGAPLEVLVTGPEMEGLERLARRIRDEVAAIPGVVDVGLSVGEPRPELRIDVDRDVANELGLDIGMIAMTVRPLFAGQTATRWEDASGEEREVVVQVAPEQRASLADVARLPIPTMSFTQSGAQRMVSLGEIARIERGTAPAQIDRRDLSRTISVTANNIGDVSVAEASATIRQRIAAMDMPEGYSARLAGQTEMLEETTGYVVEAIILSVILIFLILASQFESLTHPLAIMVSLPLSLIGVLLALLITGDTMNMMSMIGVILLMGLVTKNAILLVDNANERRALGRDRRQALLEAGVVRMRPIMMTTLAMIFGMLPIALALGEGSGFRAPMARAVIGGLITSTALTLLVVPVAYTYLDDLGAWVKRRFVSAEREAELKKEQEQAGLKPEPVWGAD